jgi:transposase
MQVATVSIDLAKNVVHVHGVDNRGHVVLRERLPRKQVLLFFTQLPPCLIGVLSTSNRKPPLRSVSPVTDMRPSAHSAVVPA